MILNNYLELRRLQQTVYLKHSSMDVVLSSSMVNTSGSGITFMSGDWADSAKTEDVAKNWDLVSNTNFLIGSSDAVGDISDYNLASVISSGFSISNTAWNITTNNGAVKKVISFNVSCSTNDGFTIKEVGICKQICNRLSGSLQYENVMLARVILDSPVTLANGESATITLEWTES